MGGYWLLFRVSLAFLGFGRLGLGGEGLLGTYSSTRKNNTAIKDGPFFRPFCLFLPVPGFEAVFDGPDD